MFLMKLSIKNLLPIPLGPWIIIDVCKLLLLYLLNKSEKCLSCPINSKILKFQSFYNTFMNI